jgi:DNA-binding transcriptional regulator YdaS (Cro superfamily)
MHSLDDVVRHFGGVSRLAQVLGVRSQAVSQWKRTDSIPKVRAYQIEVMSYGRFKAEKLPVRRTRSS